MSKLRKIPSMRTKDGWRSRTIYIADSMAVSAITCVAAVVFVAPTGVELVHVRNGEEPEFVVRFPGKGLPPAYLRKYAGSSTQRAHERARAGSFMNLAWALADKRREKAARGRSK